MTHDELVRYHDGDAVERPCRWDDGAIIVRQHGLTAADDAVADAIRDHQATLAHQAARRALGIVDTAPRPLIR